MFLRFYDDSQMAPSNHVRAAELSVGEREIKGKSQPETDILICVQVPTTIKRGLFIRD